jgi:hypothetical protein
MSGKNEGKEAVLQALGQIGENFKTFQVSPDEMIEEGGTIVVLSHVDAKTKSGNEVKARRRDLAHERRKGQARPEPPRHGRAEEGARGLRLGLRRGPSSPSPRPAS